MTWFEIVHAPWPLRNPDTFVRLEGGTLDIGIWRPDHEDESLPDLFEETFTSLVPPDH